MGRRLILDTCVLIDLERGALRLSDLAADEDELAMAAVTAAELWEGVVRADEARKGRRVAFFERAVEQFPVEDYNLDIALKHGELLAHARLSGKPRGHHDLIIAATAAQTWRVLVTRDGKAVFEGLPGVAAVYLGRG